MLAKENLASRHWQFAQWTEIGISACERKVLKKWRRIVCVIIICNRLPVIQTSIFIHPAAYAIRPVIVAASGKLSLRHKVTAGQQLKSGYQCSGHGPFAFHFQLFNLGVKGYS